MDRLLYVIVTTTDLAATTRFYRERLGLASAQDNARWVDYRTGGARLATMEISPRSASEIELSFHVPDLETTVASLRAAGVTFMGDIKTIPFGRLAHLRDPNGTLLSLYAPDRAPEELDGPPRLLAILNADDFAGTVAFYRDTLGFEIAEEERGRVTFETGATRLVVQRRAHGEDHPDHAAQKVVVGLEVADLGRAAAEMRANGLHFATAPTDDDEGSYAEATDPEGNLVVVREPAPAPALEEVLAEAYEDDDAPARSAIRRPVQKQSKAVSRVAIKPDYKPKKSAKRAAAAPASRRRRESAASTRGAGPAGTRLKPKTTRDPKRAKAKPAAGRAKKASARAATDKKRAVAKASKGRPVKRAVSRGGGRSR